jgi:hypothetical protein
MIKKKKIFVPFLVLLALSIPAVFWLLVRGFYEPHDLHHFADIYQMVRAIQSGQFPPRLGPDFTFGYGYPLFNFYYLLPFYLGAFWFFLVGSLTASFKFVFILSVLLSVSGMYLFLREFLGKFPAVVGSVLFLYTPYRAVEIYVRGAMGETLALALLPFVAWGVTRIIKQPKNRKLIVGVSLITAIFILSHNYLWALAFPWIAFLAVLLIKESQRKASAINLLMISLFSIGLTTFWWLPALLENKLVSSVTPFPLIDHFPFIKQLIIPSWGHGASVWGPTDEMSFQIGIVNLLVVLLSSALLVFSRKLFKDRKTYLVSLWALGGFFVSVFMMNIRSLFIWKLIPFYEFIQFPWRLLFLTTFFTAVLAGVITQVLPKRQGKITGFLIIIAGLVLTFTYFAPSKVFYKTDDDYLARFFADRTISGKRDEFSKQYIGYSEDYLLLPNWVDERPTNLPISRIEAAGEVEIENIEEINPVHWKANVVVPEASKITFHAYYFPGWFAEVDGEKTAIEPGKPHGQIEIVVSEGEHTVEFYWAETPLRKAADLISLVSLLLLIGFFAKGRIKKK